MNNKFIKRVAAVVLGVAVLSTCAFAAANNVDDSTYADGTLTFSYASDADKVSYIAYASENGVDKGTIVAIGQIDNNEGADSIDVPVNTTLVGSAKYIIVESGDSNGSFDATSIATSDYSVVTTVVNDGKTAVKVGELTFTDMPVYNFVITLNKAGSVAISKVTASYTESGVAKTNELKNVSALKFLNNVNTGAAGGTVRVEDFFLVGAPDAFLNAADAKIIPSITVN